MERRALWSVAAIVTATAGAAVLPPVAAQAAPAAPGPVRGGGRARQPDQGPRRGEGPA